MDTFDSSLLKELQKEQLELSKKVVIQDLQQEVKLIAGCDSSIIEDKYIFSIFVVFKYPSLDEIEIKFNHSPIELPYIPGYLAFREIPNLLKVYDQLENKPDLIMVDGNGIIHPRRMGIASHLGVLLNKPTIGVAKKLLFGKTSMPENPKGNHSEIKHQLSNEIIGYSLRSKDNVKPILVSPGHLVSLKDSLNFVLDTLRKHKLPEPTRIADLYSKKFKTTDSNTKFSGNTQMHLF